MSNQAKVMYPLTVYPFDKEKRYCRVCHAKLRRPTDNSFYEMFTIYYEALCSVACLLKMHQANETQLDDFIEWGDKALNILMEKEDE